MECKLIMVWVVVGTGTAEWRRKRRRWLRGCGSTSCWHAHVDAFGVVECMLDQSYADLAIESDFEARLFEIAMLRGGGWDWFFSWLKRELSVVLDSIVYPKRNLSCGGR